MDWTQEHKEQVAERLGVKVEDLTQTDLEMILVWGL